MNSPADSDRGDALEGIPKRRVDWLGPWLPLILAIFSAGATGAFLIAGKADRQDIKDLNMELRSVRDSLQKLQQELAVHVAAHPPPLRKKR